MGRRIIVIGGGASGLIAAARAAELGADTLVIERMERPARKLAITGKGRCNFTTGHDVARAIEAFGANGRFLHSAFGRFYSEDIIAILESRGVRVKEERGKRYFPESDRALDVVDALAGLAADNGAKLMTGFRVERIGVEGGRVASAEAVGPDGSRVVFEADAAIAATGGMSYPGTGSTGDGYRLARELGHTVVPPVPALAPIELVGDAHPALSPLSLKNASAALTSGGVVVKELFGDMMFTPFGATGPIILDMGKIAAGKKPRERMELVVNFKPAMSPEQVRARLLREFEAAGAGSVRKALETMLPKRAVPVALRLAGVALERKASQVTKEQRDAIQAQLTGMRFEVKGARPIEEAIVTAGGVALAEINPRTMESRIVRRLFVCGELLDIDGPTGGFNLQAAFSTGYLAGESAAAD